MFSAQFSESETNARRKKNIFWSRHVSILQQKKDPFYNQQPARA